MKSFRKYIFPAVYGLLVYFTIRLLHDTDVGLQFWKRYWFVNAVEIACSVVVGYAGTFLFERLFRYYDSRRPVQVSYREAVKELAVLVAANLLLVNIVFVPMDIALHDVPIPTEDIVDINVIPTLFAIIYYGISRSSTWLRAYADNKMQLEKITNDHLETELKFLKAQYHPHFLFNALNTIYFQMDEDVDGAKNSIEKFSELLRYQLYDQQQQVPVQNELSYLQSFIDLQKLRSSEKLQMEVSFDKALNGQLVYPLLFLPLVENAFKFIGGDYKLAICAQLADNKLIFSVENSIPQFKQPLV
ncbi:MAG: sensor histidine kinase, partial [Mucilaginibacter sp.]